MSTPWGPVPPPEGSGGQPDYQPQQPGYAPPGGYQPGQAPQGPPPQGYGPVTVGSQPRKPRKGRVALIAGGVVVALGLTGGGVLALTNGWFSRGGAGGAGSAEAAAVSFLESAVKLDSGDVLANLAPSERALVSDLVGVSESQPKPQGEAKQAMDALNDAKAALSITLPTTPTFKTEELATGVTKATVTGGSIRIDGDAGRIADDLVTVMKAYGASSDLTSSDARDQIRDSIAQYLPFETGLTALASQMNLDNGLFLVTVQEDGKWYVSASMTIAQYIAEANGVTKDQLGDTIPASDMKKFSTPQDAVTGLYDAIDTTVSTGDLRELAKALPPAESRLVAVYGPVLTQGSSGGSGSSLGLSDLSASPVETDGDHAYVALDSFTADLGSGATLAYQRDGKKFTITGLQDGDTMLSIVLDGTDPKSWTFTLGGDGTDTSGEASLSVPGKGQLEGEYSMTTQDYWDGDITATGSFSFDGDCLSYSRDDGYSNDYYDGTSSGQTCGLADALKGTGLENFSSLPALDRLLSVTTLKSGDSWYASPTATFVGFYAELARAFQS